MRKKVGDGSGGGGLMRNKQVLNTDTEGYLQVNSSPGRRRIRHWENI